MGHGVNTFVHRCQAKRTEISNFSSAASRRFWLCCDAVDHLPSFSGMPPKKQGAELVNRMRSKSKDNLMEQHLLAKSVELDER